MRLSKLMGLAIVLVALAVSVNALAFKTAQVTNNMSLVFQDSTAAGLAFAAAATPDPGVSTALDGTTGITKFTLSQKMQPGSVYTFDPAFKITNNNASGTVTLAYSAITLTGGVTITLLKSGTTTDISDPSVTIAAAGSQDVAIKVTVPAGFVASGGTLSNTAVDTTVQITGTR